MQDELCFFEIDFISNAHNWGVSVVDPDGNVTTKLASHESDIYDIRLVYDKINMTLSVLHSEKYDMYEIFLEQ